MPAHAAGVGVFAVVAGLAPRCERVRNRVDDLSRRRHREGQARHDARAGAARARRRLPRRRAAAATHYLELAGTSRSWTVDVRQSGRVARRRRRPSRTQRTPNGVGPGASGPRSCTRIPGGRCTFNVRRTDFGRVEYLVAAQRRHADDLHLPRHLRRERRQRSTGYGVVEVHVRTPFEPLPEFAPGWRDQCARRLGEHGSPCRLTQARGSVRR